MKQSISSRIYIKERMFTLKMVEVSAVDDHLEEFNEVRDTLGTFNEALND